jgi:hypothetical protein
VLYLEHEKKLLYGVLFCFVTAVCANLRFMGMMIPGLMIGYLLLRDLFVRRVYRLGVKAVLKCIGGYILLGVGFLAVYIAINPACWVSPLKSVVKTILHFSYYDNWSGTSIFMGREVPWNAVPWYFIPVWMLISLPVWYSVLFGGALVLIALFFIMPARVAKRLDLSGESNAQSTYLSALLQAPYHYMLFAFALFFSPLLLVIVRGSVLYNDWRQMYFLLVPFVCARQGHSARLGEVRNRRRHQRRAIVSGGLDCKESSVRAPVSQPPCRTIWRPVLPGRVSLVALSGAKVSCRAR